MSNNPSGSYPPQAARAPASATDIIRAVALIAVWVGRALWATGLAWAVIIMALVVWAIERAEPWEPAFADGEAVALLVMTAVVCGPPIAVGLALAGSATGCERRIPTCRAQAVCGEARASSQE